MAQASGDGRAPPVAGEAEAEGELYDEEMLAFCRAMPKVELHAHLNGCIRDSTIRCVRIARSRTFAGGRLGL